MDRAAISSFAMSHAMTDPKFGTNVMRQDKQPSARARTAGPDVGSEPHRRRLSHEEIIERAKAERAAMIAAFFWSLASSMRSLFRTRLPRADALKRAHAPSQH